MRHPIKPEQNPVKRALIRPTRKNAIDAMCAQCLGCTKDHIESGFRESIRDCTAPHCSLFPFRPYQVKKQGASILKTDLDPQPSQGIGAPAKPSEKILAVGKRGAQI
ncbi:MAG: hypothetical protein CMK46_00750 [Porticoccus sp.]|nr:hypothetical protein [Porticoccus sp.]|tara:strand:- start:6157 stop:6477 length:321 start_codon:yes stop_codon:yes gene_type:complete